MNLKSLSKRQWTLLSVCVVIIGVAVWGIQAGYLPEIGKFFAAEPGYVPYCAWYGEQRAAGQECCAGFVPVPATRPFVTPILNEAGVEVSLPDGEIAAEATMTPVDTTAPVRLAPEYCVLPGCTVIRRAVRCIQAPCEPVVDIVCPEGVTPPPPRPTATPTPEMEVINIISPQAGENIYITSDYDIAWQNTPATALSPVSIQLYKGAADINTDLVNTYTIVNNTPNTGTFRWRTGDPVRRMSDGSMVQLWDHAGGDFRLYVRTSNPWGSGGTDYFSLSAATPTPTTTSTVTPTPLPFEGISVGFGFLDGVANLQVPLESSAYNIPIYLKPVPGIIAGAQVTAVSMRLRYHPDFITITNIQSPYFPDVLKAPEYTTASGFEYVEFTLGSGTKSALIKADTPAINLVIKPLKAGLNEFIALDRPVITAPNFSANVWRALGGHTMSVHMDIVVSAKPGDANGDGKVDIFDYNLVVSNFGKVGSNILGDVNSDGKVDIFDYNLVITNFGK